MKIEEATHALLEELKRLRSEGLKEIYFDEKNVLALEKAMNSRESDHSENLVSKLEGKGRHSLTSSEFFNLSSSLGDSKHAENPPSEEIRQKGRNSSFPSAPKLELPEGGKAEKWNWLKDRVMSCETCKQQLNPNAKVVYGVGNLDAEIFFCGEAPGAEEEQQGEPFVGPAGNLLDRIIEAMGISRDSVYLGNILNWRPQHSQAYGNRPPTIDEVEFCIPYLMAQIQIIRPKVVIALGKTATDGLLGHNPKRRLSDCRGRWNDLEGIPLMVTYHPSYLLHNPSKMSKRKVWEDMLMVMEKLEMPISQKQKDYFI